MEITDRFHVSTPIDETWKVLLESSASRRASRACSSRRSTATSSAAW